MITKEESLLLVADDIEPVKNFVVNAFQLKLKGDAAHYTHINNLLKKRDDHDTLWKIYIALCSCVSQVSSRPDKWQDLILAIFTYDWNLELKITVAFVNLLGNLVSANAIFLLPAFHMVVRNLKAEQAPGVLPTVGGTEVLLKQRNDRFQHIHRTLFGLISLAPSGLSELFPILRDHFPHKRIDVSVQVEYVTQLLTICNYLPALQPKILDVIVSKCLEIDVEIIIEDSGEVKIQEEEEEIDDGGMMFDIDDNYGKAPAHNRSNFNKDHSQKIADEVSEMAEKLDAILAVVVDFIDNQIQKSLSLSPTSVTAADLITTTMEDPSTATLSPIDKLFHHLLSIFEERILSTHRSKFVQYIMFYITSKSEKYTFFFCKKLLSLFLDNSTITITPLVKQSAVVYLASFVSRSKFITGQFISDLLEELLRYSNDYVLRHGCDMIEWSSDTTTEDVNNLTSVFACCRGDSRAAKASSSAGVSPAMMARSKSMGNVAGMSGGHFEASLSKAEKINKHETFYCCVQALCYICCFYGSEVVQYHITLEHLRRRWECVLTSSLRPLKYCLRSVKIEYVRLIVACGLLREECWALLPADLMSSSSSSTSSITCNSSYQNPLDSFFPFDPCLLLKVHQRVEHIYRSWTGIPGVDCDYEVSMAMVTDEKEGREEVHGAGAVSSSASSQGSNASSAYRNLNDQGNGMARSIQSMATSSAASSWAGGCEGSFEDDQSLSHSISSASSWRNSRLLGLGDNVGSNHVTADDWQQGNKRARGLSTGSSAAGSW